MLKKNKTKLLSCVSHQVFCALCYAGNRRYPNYLCLGSQRKQSCSSAFLGQALTQGVVQGDKSLP